MGNKKKLSISESRRKFLRTSIVGGIAVTSLPSISFGNKIQSIADNTFDVKKFDLDEITIGEIRQGFESGKFTIRSLTEKYIARIKEIDKNGPSLNSVIELNPDALQMQTNLIKN